MDDTCLTLGPARKSMTHNWLLPDKYEIRRNQVKCLGHLIDRDGIHADPDKTAAVVDMGPPKNVSDLQTFMGMVNQLENSPEISHPL